MEVVILAGGKGSRLSSVISDIPKSMANISGKPILERMIINCKKYKFTSLHILVGYMSEYIIRNIGNGSKFGVKITYYKDKSAYGTAGSVKAIQNILKSPFLMLYSDIFFDMDLDKLVSFSKKKGGYGTLVCHPNNHPIDSDLLSINNDHKIVNFYPKLRTNKNYYQNMVNAGIAVLNPKVLNFVKKDEFSDFGTDIFPKLISKKLSLFGYHSSEYIADIGTPKRFKKVEDDFLNGLPKKLNLSNKQKAVFLDRDGTLIKYIPYIKYLEDVELIEDVEKAIEIFSKEGYVIVVVTNQPQVARGDITEELVQEMHNKIDYLLGKYNQKIESYYFCPHHPDKGYEGEVKKYKIKCDCRKPSLELYKKAASKFNIDLKNSIFIGDSTCDILVGNKLKGMSFLVNTGLAGSDKIYKVKPSFRCDNLYEAANKIVSLKQ